MVHNLLKKIFNNRVLIPFYHIVTDLPPIHTRNLYICRDIKTFSSDIDYLLKHYTPVDISGIYDSIFNNKQLPKNSFHLSFDDGFSEMYDIVAPILKEKGVPATFFINSGFIDNKDLMFRCKVSILIDIFNNSRIIHKNIDRINQLLGSIDITESNFIDRIKRISYNQKHLLDDLLKVVEFDLKNFLTTEKPYLTSDQVKSLSRDGFSIGGHSVDHSRYHKLTVDEQISQTLGSINQSLELSNQKIKIFSFPFSEDGIGKEFYERVEKDVDLLFGTFDNKRDPISFCLQRFAMDDYGERLTTTEEKILSLYKRYIMRYPFGKNRVKRF